MYAAFAKSAFLTQIAYRGQVWGTIFGELIYLFSRISIWTSLIAAGATVSGATLPDMVTYAVIAGTVLGAWDPRDFFYTVSTSLKSGDIAMQFLKPVPYPAYLFARECGNLAFRTIAVALPVTLVAFAVYGLQPPASVFHGATFVVFWLLSFLIGFEFACIGGLIAFWLLTAFSIEWLLRAAISLLSGSFIPLWFFPEWLAGTLKVLPFAWLAYHPAAIYLGKVGVGETLLLLLLGIGWAALLALGIYGLWRKATRQLAVQGG